MQRAAGLLLGISLILGGCNKGGCSSCSATAETKISNRPIVSFVPLIDHSRNELNWNISQELTQTIRQRLVQKNQLYMTGEESLPEFSKKAISSHDPFDLDISWIRKAFPQNEFVVFTELLEHNETPLDLKDAPAELTMSVRVRVFDLRDKTPRVVLQEIVQQSHHVPRQFTKGNLNQVPWGDETFDVSPLGLAHDQLCKELASRIEDYILISGL